MGAISSLLFDRYLKGDSAAISAEAKASHDLFTGKANCIACHNGPLAANGKLHRTGVPETRRRVWHAAAGHHHTAPLCDQRHAELHGCPHRR